MRLQNCISLVRAVASSRGLALLLGVGLSTQACVTAQSAGDLPKRSDDSVPNGVVAGSQARASTVTDAAGAGDEGVETQGATLESYTLTVDSPADGSALQGNVVVSGHAPGFTDLEVWDANGAQLAQAPVCVDGSFGASIDTSQFPSGATTWTVKAFDGLPALGYSHSAQVSLSLTLGTTVTATPPTTEVPPAETTADAPDPGMAFVPAGYHLAFSDEFSDATLDTTKWNTRAPWNVEWYADSHQLQAFIADAVSVNQGALSFTADYSKGNTDGQPYASGSITSNRTFTYGYFETRLSVPAGKGFWPAYWLTSSVRWPPELDIFEIVDGVDYSYTHIVPGGTFSFIEGAAGAQSAYPLTNPYGVYHVYGFQWTATDIYRYVDGVLTEHDAIDAAGGSGDPFWLNFSLQVGGDWPGAPDASTPFPSHMDIDYVRIYEQ